MCSRFAENISYGSNKSPFLMEGSGAAEDVEQRDRAGQLKMWGRVPEGSREGAGGGREAHPPLRDVPSFHPYTFF